MKQVGHDSVDLPGQLAGRLRRGAKHILHASAETLQAIFQFRQHGNPFTNARQLAIGAPVVHVGSSKLAAHFTEPPFGTREQRAMLFNQRSNVCLGLLRSN